MSTKKFCDACQEEIASPTLGVAVTAERNYIRNFGDGSGVYDFHVTCWQTMLNIGTGVGKYGER